MKGLSIRAALLCLVAGSASSAVVSLTPADSVQAAIDASTAGDILELAPGTYTGEIDFGGRAITIVGTGRDTVLQGTGAGPVVTFDSGEGRDSVLDSVVVTGGLATQGGGIFVLGASPTITRSVVIENQARMRGSGIYLENSMALIRNNAVLYNSSAQGDPHAIEVVEAAPEIINNTIVRNDSNGIILRGDSPARLLNNLIASNGVRRRGRGICDFSNGSTVIHYNLFWRNRRAALLTGGKDFRRIDRAERAIGAPRLLGNRSGNPEFSPRKRPLRLGSRRFERATRDELVDGVLTDPAGRKMRTVDAGDPDPIYNDRDQTRNDIGVLGGPEAPNW